MVPFLTQLLSSFARGRHPAPARRRRRALRTSHPCERLESRLALAADAAALFTLLPTESVYLDASQWGPAPVVIETAQVVGSGEDGFVVTAVASGVVEKWDAAEQVWRDVSTQPTTSNPRELLRLLRERTLSQGDLLRWTPASGNTTTGYERAFTVRGWEDSVVPPAPAPTAPAAVANLTVSSTVPCELTANWQVPATPAVTASTATINDGRTTSVYLTPTTSVAFPDLAAETTYTFSVWATNASGAGPVTKVGFQSPPAQPGTLDAGFGDSGVASFQNGHLLATQSALDDQGRSLVIGESGDDQGRIVRFTATGEFDPTFGGPMGYSFTGGRTTALTTHEGGVIFSAISDGQEFVILRTSSSGAPDPSFNGNGVWVSEDVAATGGTMVVDSQGRITMFINFEHNARSVTLVQRILADGTPDSTFNALVLDPPDFDLVIRDATVLQDDSVAFTGQTIPTTTGQTGFAFGRVLSDGTLETPGGGSLNQYDVTQPNINFDGQVIAVQPDGKYLVAGQATNSETGEITAFIARYLAIGQIDLPFGAPPDDPQIGLGAIGIDLGENPKVFAIVSQANGKIVIAGGTTLASGDVGFTQRVTDDGFLDHTFGTDSAFPGAVFTSSGVNVGVHVRDDGRLVVAGSSTQDDAINVMQYNAC